MKRIGSLLLIFAIVYAADAGSGAARQQRPERELRAVPRDVREIFLTMPYPSAPKDSLAEAYADYMDTSEKRWRLLEEPFAKPGQYENTVDTTNGYLRLNLNDNWGQYIILTHFTRADGRRLIALQFVNENHVEQDPHTEDHFFWLGQDGRYTEVLALGVLPPISLDDFWGEQPRAPANLRSLFADDHLYNIEWPREGTTAVVRSYPPYNRTGTLTPAERRARDAFGRRRYETMLLLWDGREGVFNKGPKKERRPGPDRRRAEAPPLPRLCAEGEATIFNCAIDEGGKFLSVCGSKMGPLFEGRGYIQYRFGRPGNIELEYPRERRRRASDFILDYKQAQGRSHFARLWFDAGPYRYTIYEEVFAGERAADIRKDARVEVRTLKNLREAVGVARSFRCLDPVQGSLGNLKELVTAAPAR